MTTFNDLNLNDEILKAITDLGFETPTPVQEKVIPHLMNNSGDLVALAQTGTGKTAAFALPIINAAEPNTRYPQALILSPTRELCLQICRDIESFTKYVKGIKPVAIYGGAPIVKQMKELAQGRQIVVATPGRLNDLIRRRKVDLSQVSTVVLDEADEMLDMGFAEELESILSEIPDDAQTLLFSATMPRSVERIAGRYMTDAEMITIGKRNSGTATVSHQYYMVHARDKYKALKRIADCYPGMYAIVFCRTRAETNDVADRLMSDGYNADALHGDLSQAQRDYVMDKFRRKTLQMLVATDVAARGLDVSNLTHVINYNLPDDVESYNHRSGRTGRAGKEGISVSIVHLREKNRIRQIERSINRTFEYIQLPSGKEACEAQLMHIMDRVKNVEVDEEQIAQYLPAVFEKLGEMTREDLIKHFVSLEFNLFLSYYKNAPDLNAQEKSRENSPRREDLKTMVINVGRNSRILPKDLIGFINSETPGQSLFIGQIEITDDSTLFEIAEQDLETFTKIFDQADFNGTITNIALSDRDVVPQERGGRGGRGGRRDGGRGGRRDGGRGGRDGGRGGRRDGGRGGRDGGRDSGGRGGRDGGRGGRDGGGYGGRRDGGRDSGGRDGGRGGRDGGGRDGGGRDGGRGGRDGGGYGGRRDGGRDSGGRDSGGRGGRDGGGYGGRRDGGRDSGGRDGGRGGRDSGGYGGRRDGGRDSGGRDGGRDGGRGGRRDGGREGGRGGRRDGGGDSGSRRD